MKQKIFLGLIALTLFVLVACSTPSPKPVPPTAVPPTSVPAKSVPPNSVPTTQVPPTVVSSSFTSAASASSKTSTSAVSLASNCTNQATFKGDELPKDNAQFAPKANISKQWAVYNTGTCTWDQNYKWVFRSGDQMGAPDAQSIGAYMGGVNNKVVAPSNFVNVTVNMTAPDSPGTYTGYWGLVNPTGDLVPIVGGTKDNTLYVKIIVPGGTSNSTSVNSAGGGITKTATKITLEQGSGTACTTKSTYFVNVDITSNGPTTAKYEISATDASGQVKDGVFDTFASSYVSDVLRFAAAETKTVNLRLVGPYSYPNAITIRVRVNGGDWQQAQLSCSTGTGQSSGVGSTGGITKTAAKITLEQGSGAACTTKSTYFVNVDITSNGPTTAKYEIYATDASGQVEDGVFDAFASSYVSDALKFATAETKSVNLRLVGPYSYPNAITIRVRVNGGDSLQVQAPCK